MLYLIQIISLAVMFVFSSCAVAKEQFCLNCKRDVAHLFFHATFGTYALGRVYCMLKYDPQIYLWLVIAEGITAILICLRFACLRTQIKRRLKEQCPIKKAVKNT